VFIPPSFGLLLFSPHLQHILQSFEIWKQFRKQIGYPLVLETHLVTLFVEIPKTHRSWYIWQSVLFLIHERVNLQLYPLLLLFRHWRRFRPRLSESINPLWLRITIGLAWDTLLQLWYSTIRYVFRLCWRTWLHPLCTLAPRPTFLDISIYTYKGLSA
jgi:hypothetical protein